MESVNSLFEEKQIQDARVQNNREGVGHEGAVETLVSWAAIALGIAGAALVLAPAPAGAANPADIAQLTETGICRACDLSGADLTGAHLIGADLRDADLTDAILMHANLEGADLTGATLIDTDLSHAYLTNAVLDDAVIANVDFSNSTLIYTSIENADIENVELVGADVISTPISVGGSYDQ